MSNERYPQNLPISLKDFEISGWKDAIAQVDKEGYSAMWQAFSAAARSAMEEGNSTRGKVLWLLADACSMMLSPSSHNEPFKPFMVFHDRRSVIPDDLSDGDIRFFAEIVDAVDDHWLKARLSDLVWLKGKPRNTAFALKAIDAYRCLSLDTDTWLNGGRECWSRAISLARMLRADNRLEEMEKAIIVAFNSATRADGFWGLWLADLLKSSGLGCSHKFNVARKLETSANEFAAEADWRRARKYFFASAEWYRAIPDKGKAAEMTAAAAEGFVKEAIARSTLEGSGNMMALHFYENAIQTYRTIPRNERAAHRVDERMTELRNLLNDAGKNSLKEMELIQTPDIDITKMVERAMNSVSGKSPKEALCRFANLQRNVNSEELRNLVLERLRKYPLQSLSIESVMSCDGRVIGRRPAMSFSGDLTDNDEIVIRADMVRDYGIHMSIVVQGLILPALEVLLLEHRLHETDFIELARHSPIVPKERAGLFGKALFAGYERDFVTALHILVPQIEHMVRVHLKQAGAITTNLDRNGIQNENGLSTLMDLPVAEDVFGKDLVFEIRSLFCDAFGPNLRNELAHGLLDEDRCYTASAIYAWWLALRLTFNTWWNTANPVGQQESNK